MGDSISEGVIGSWLKKSGDSVEADEVVVLIDTDKISLEVRAPVAGVIKETLVEESATVPVGADLFTIEAGAAASSSAKSDSSAAPKAKAPEAPKAAEAKSSSAPASSGSSAPSAAKEKVSIKVPTLTESVNRGTVRDILVKAGQSVKADEVVLVIDTDKISIDVRAPAAGVVDSVLVTDGQEVGVGDNLINMLSGGAGAETSKPAAAPVAETPSAAAAAKPSAPAAASSSAPSKPASKAPAAGSSRPIVGATGPVDRTDTRVRMTPARKRTAQRLKDSQNTAAILTTFNEVDMHNLMQLREQYKDRFLERFGTKLGFMSAFAKASAIALQENPVVNAVMDGDDIIYRNYVDISVAVSTPTSLVVPVLRNVERMSFADIERTIAEFGAKAKENKLTLEDMSGGTFTISNGGVFGSLMGTPIINPPQSAILGMHAINKRAHVVNDKVEVRPMMYIALSYDHRIIDGRDAVTTLKRIKTLIEDPVSMLLDL